MQSSITVAAADYPFMQCQSCFCYKLMDNISGYGFPQNITPEGVCSYRIGSTMVIKG